MLKFRTLFLAASTIFIFSFTNQGGDKDIFGIVIKQLNGEDFILSEIKKNKATIVIFLDPECPISQKFSTTISSLSETYKSENVEFYGVFPSPFILKEEIENFKTEFNFEIQFYRDPRLLLVNHLQANITPEAFLIDPSGKVVYQGMINDWYFELGKYRPRINNHYLKVAIDELLHGNKIATPRTKAIGCMINNIPQEMDHSKMDHH